MSTRDAKIYQSTQERLIENKIRDFYENEIYEQAKVLFFYARGVNYDN